MKKAGKYMLWTLSIIAWLIVVLIFFILDSASGSITHQIIIIITGICLALYIWRKTDSGAKKLEQKVQELEKENQTLRQELQDQAVRHAMDKTDKTN